MTLQCCLTLSFLGGQHGLTLCLGLTRNFCKTFCFGLARGFCSLSCETRGKLRFFLALAFGFFFESTLLGGFGLFYTQASFFTLLSP